MKVKDILIFGVLISLLLSLLPHTDHNNYGFFIMGFLGGIGKAIGGIIGGIVGGIFGGRKKETQTQVVENPYAREVWHYFKDTYLPEVKNKFREVQSIFQNQMSLASNLQNQLLYGTPSTFSPRRPWMPIVRPSLWMPEERFGIFRTYDNLAIPNLFHKTNERINSLSEIDWKLNTTLNQANTIFNKTQQLGDTYAGQVDTALNEIRQRLDNIGSYYDEAIQNAKSIFESEVNKGRGVMALSGFMNTPLLQRTIQEEFSKIVSPFLRDKAQTQAQAQQILSEYLFKAPQVKTDIQKDFQATSLFALDRILDTLKQQGALRTTQAEAYQKLAQVMPSVYSSIFELGYTPARDYATMIRNFLDLQHINPIGAMNFGIVNKERTVFDPIGALAGGILGWLGSRR